MGTNAWSKGSRRAVLGAVMAGAFLAVSASASAACTAGICTWDTDGDAPPEVVTASQAGTSVAVQSRNPNDDRLTARTAGTTAAATLWWSDENGDLDPEVLYANANAQSVLVPGRPTGAYGTLYMIDRDQGDLVDYVYTVAQVGVDRYGAGTSFAWSDPSRDLEPGGMGTSTSSAT